MSSFVVSSAATIPSATENACCDMLTIMARNLHRAFFSSLFANQLNVKSSARTLSYCAILETKPRPCPATACLHHQQLELRAFKSTGSSYNTRGKAGSSKKGSSDDDDEIEEDSSNNSDLDPSLMDDVDGKDTKIVRAKLNSLRLDSLLKAALGTAKNKVEVAFYESRIRINGEKILKKSKRMDVGDEIDLIKGFNHLNPNFLDVSRVIIVAADVTEDMEKIRVVLKRYKSLTIENYPEPFKKAVTSSD